MSSNLRQWAQNSDFERKIQTMSAKLRLWAQDSDYELEIQTMNAKFRLWAQNSDCAEVTKVQGISPNSPNF